MKTLEERISILEKTIGIEEAVKTPLQNKWKLSNLRVKRGSEGPSHDPYSFQEFSFKINGEDCVFHNGLVQWIKFRGKKTNASGKFYDEDALFFQEVTGFSYDILEDEIGEYYNHRDNDEEDPMGSLSDYI